ncbi:hypothetical protein pb186bvf_009324 [Paramecium bursaria]
MILFIIISKVFGCPPNCDYSKQYCYDSVCLDLSCISYTSRFGTVYQGTTGSLPINFYSTVGINSNNNIAVSVQFVDNMTDPTMNFDNPKSCLTTSVFRYGPQFIGPEIKENVTMISSYIQQVGYRNWTFEIQPNEFDNKLTRNKTDSQIEYIGFYGIRFLIQSITQVTFLFSFSINLNTKVVANTTNNNLISGTSTCYDYPNNTNCTSNPNSQIIFCKDYTCSETTTNKTIPQFSYAFFIFSITDKEFQNWTLLPGEVYAKTNDTYNKITVVNTTGHSQFSYIPVSSIVYTVFFVSIPAENATLYVNCKMAPPTKARMIVNQISYGQSVTNSKGENQYLY